ncbi:MAG: helix-turn-helix domain-containing protein [Gammaproteobacteria bacterium]|nr:helix-turn-helix domain-containing protein [Gammaproteobacteria bacterium]
MSIEQVALLVGYSEASNFHRAFKKHVGLTPKNFRQSS